MTDSQKVKKLDTLEYLGAKVGGWFGCDDSIFAGHAFDEERAKEARTLAYSNDITLQ